MLGRQVAVIMDETKPAGQHEIRLETLGMTNGVYFFQDTGRRMAGQADPGRGTLNGKIWL